MRPSFSALAPSHMTIRFKPVIVAGGVTLNKVGANKPSLRTKLALASATALAALAALATLALV